MAAREERKARGWIRTPRPYMRIENVTKHFGNFVAVNDVSLTI